MSIDKTNQYKNFLIDDVLKSIIVNGKYLINQYFNDGRLLKLVSLQEI